MNTKAKGRRFERVVRDYYRSQGYLVLTSAASLGADLVALQLGKPQYIIECKAGKLYGAERDRAIKKLSIMAAQTGCLGVLAEKDSRDEKGFTEIVIS